jgi:hypothetical protein
MAFPYEPEIMNFFIAPSLVQLVAVQNVFRRSRSNLATRLPSALEACRADRKTYHAKLGKKRHALRRRRVIEISTMP